MDLGLEGKIKTQTSLDILWGKSEAGANHNLKFTASHNVSVYLIKGELTINGTEVLEEDGVRMLCFLNDGEGISIVGNKNAEFIALSGEPLKEKVATYGPFVMNTQEELVTAVEDYQTGRMGRISRG